MQLWKSPVPNLIRWLVVVASIVYCYRAWHISYKPSLLSIGPDKKEVVAPSPIPKITSDTGEELNAVSPVSLSGEAAKEQLQKEGSYESLNDAFRAALYAVSKIDPAEPEARGADYFAFNQGQKLRAWFGENGIELASSLPSTEGNEPWSVQFRLTSIGRGGEQITTEHRRVTASGSRVEISSASGTITEWYENRSEGIEHGFTIAKQPAGLGGLLEVVLGVTGSARIQGHTDPESDGIRLVDRSGSPLLTYSKLKAWDAAGRHLPARMEARGGGELALLISDGGAQYPITIDPLFANVEARLTGQSFAGNQFGAAIAISGNLAVVGNPGWDSEAGVDAGAAFVFAKDAGTWTYEASLTPNDGFDKDRFGRSVAISGTTVAVGTGDIFRNGALNPGYVCIFVRNSGKWIEQQRMRPGRTNFDFGASVSISGDTLSVGSPGSKSVHVYVRTGDSWTEQALLSVSTQSDLNTSTYFGMSVSLDKDMLLVGAPYTNVGNKLYAGAAYVFLRAGVNWNLQAELAPAEVQQSAQFGFSVALVGDIALIGANSYGGPQGAAFVFKRNGVDWKQEAQLTGDSSNLREGFGNAVALSPSGDRALVGAPGQQIDIGAGAAPGRAYIFERTESTWLRRTVLMPGLEQTDDKLGSALALSADTVLVGSPLFDTHGAVDAGSVFTFERLGGEWQRKGPLVAAVVTARSYIGQSVAISGNTAVIGAPNMINLFETSKGCAYVFVRDIDRWRLQAKLSFKNGTDQDYFGQAVAVHGDSILVGGSDSAHVYVRVGDEWRYDAQLAPNTELPWSFGSRLSLYENTAVVSAYAADTSAGTRAGRVYIFTRDGDAWLQQATLDSPSAIDNEEFGASVSVDGNMLLVGAHHARDISGRWAGAVYVYERKGGTWTEQSKLVTSDTRASDFGAAVSLSGDTALIGASYYAIGDYVGRAYIYVRSGGTWIANAVLAPVNRSEVGGFGEAVAISGDIAIVGAPFLDNYNGMGRVFVFARQGAVWSPQLNLTAGVDSSDGDYFGGSVALSGGIAVVGATGDDSSGIDNGSAYAFLIGELPRIDQQPESRVVAVGASITFSVVARGAGPLQYQWRKNGFEIEGARNASYSKVNIQREDVGTYDVVISNAGGAVTSVPATLSLDEISSFMQGDVGIPQDAEGFIIVNILPSNIGGAWRFVGEQEWRHSGAPVGGLTTSNREIEYRTVAGYRQPERDLVEVISGEQPTIINSAYISTGEQGTGSLTVTLKPATLASPERPLAQRAQWRFLGEGDPTDPNDATSPTWRDSGTRASQLSAGAYLIESKPILGRATPQPVQIVLRDGENAEATVIYYLAGTLDERRPKIVPFEVVTSNPQLPYRFVGQLRSDYGSGTGFVVRPRVVATAAHVVFDSATLSPVTNIQWIFQRDRGTYEPKPQTPRGFFLLDGYASQLESEPDAGTSSPETKTLDAAALYFLEDAGRGDYAGYLASDSDDNEWLLSARKKMLLGYPIQGVDAPNQGRMHATAESQTINFSQVYRRVFKTQDITSTHGSSGGPLCVQLDNGTYFPAAIYLGGSHETLVRAIDGELVELFKRADVRSYTGENSTNGGITQIFTTELSDSNSLGAIQVTIKPEAAVSAGAQWRIKFQRNQVTSPWQNDGANLPGLEAGIYTLELKSMAAFQPPVVETALNIQRGKKLNVTFTYAERRSKITSNASKSGMIREFFTYQITASGSPTSFGLDGILPTGLEFVPATGLIRGIPTETGIFPIRAKATGVGGSAEREVTLIIGPSLILLPFVWQSGEPLTYRIPGRNTSVTYNATGLPPGLNISADGQISGTPNKIGKFLAQISATENGATTTVIAEMTIEPAFPGNSDASGSVGQIFNQAPLYIPDGGVTYSYTGVLPPGLTFHGETGRIIGTPTASGHYTISITAAYDGGITKRDFTIVINSLLTMSTTPGGDVFEIIESERKPVTALSARAPGVNCTFIAEPRDGYFFAGWAGLEPTVLTPKVTFTPVDSLEVTPVFRAFSEFEGNYVGLLLATPSSYERSGLIRLSITRKGSFTGKLQFGGLHVSLIGAFDPTGARELPPWSRPSPLAPVPIVVRLNGLGAADVEAKVGQIATILRPVLPITSPSPVPSKIQGRYTALLAAMASPGGPVPPLGEGPVSLSVSRFGKVRLLGVLPDGTPFSAAGPLLETNEFLLYSRLKYARLTSGSGSLVGAITFSDETATDAEATSMRWFRPSNATTDSTFPAGWPDGIDAVMKASRYATRKTNAGVVPTIPLFPALPSGGTLELTLDSGEAGVQINRDLTLSATGNLSLTTPGVEKVRLSLNPKSGWLSGSFMDSSQPLPIRRTLRGALLRKSNRGGGFFSSAEGGTLTLQPK